MQTDMPLVTERRRHDVADLGDDGGMGAALGVAHHEHAIEQLQPLADEHAEIYQPLVLDTSPAPGRHFLFEGRGHAERVPAVRR